jgi:hypothetical protein
MPDSLNPDIGKRDGFPDELENINAVRRVPVRELNY